MQLPNIPVKVLRGKQETSFQALENQIVNLKEFLSGKFVVIDLWHSKCTRCPAALEKLNIFANEFGNDILFLALSLSQGDGDEEFVREIITE
jgi:thiol-disulfide isomerase/thioredoxin